MANPNKAKGTAWERACEDYLASKLDLIRRCPPHGPIDKGDLWSPGIAWQCKNHKTLDLAGWTDATVGQAENAGEKYGIALVKRRNHGVGRGYAVTTVETMARLVAEVEHLKNELKQADAVINALRGPSWPSGHVVR